MRTGENEMGLKKIIDMTRMIAIVILLLHFYAVCYQAFNTWGWTHPMGDRVLSNIIKAGLLKSFNKPKVIALGFLALSLLGAKGRKGDEFHYRSVIIYLLMGLLLYFFSFWTIKLDAELTVIAILYMGITSLGFILFMTGGSLLARIIKQKLSGEVFNTLNETFPQEERLIENKYSLNFRATYNLKGKIRASWVNLPNPFKGVLVMGQSGTGKTAYVVKDIIRQQIQKGFGMFIHDFKFPDLTNIAYYHFQKNKHRYKNEPGFYVIDFENIQHRCNPLMPQSINSITDAASASRAILLGLNQDWLDQQGDFWIESSINFVTALIWYLRLYDNGIYCTLPHVIELAQTDLDKLFSILRAEPTLEALVNPFVKAYQEDASKQLMGQISGAAVVLGTLSTEKLYYVLSGDDFTMSINDPQHPKVVCIANNPQVANVYSALVSLYLSNLQKLLKEQEEQPCGIMLEEFANISWPGVDKFLSVCRSYLVSTTLVIQDASQLTMHYGKQQADVILSMVGNLISGQVAGDSAKALSERFGKIMQDRRSVSTNSTDTSVNQSKQLDYAIPQSTISTLSAGQFVGVVADTPDQRIPQKMFHAEFQGSFKQVKHVFSRSVKGNDYQHVKPVFINIKKEINELVIMEVAKIVNTPALKNLVISKK
jgi:hypothetical protein